MTNPRLLLTLICWLIVSLGNHAQDADGYTKLPLGDLSSFRPQAGNWQIVGEVMMNPQVDWHQQANHEARDDRGKRKRKRQTKPEPPQAVTIKAGEGILLNLNDEERRDPLLTTWEHGDIQLDLEVMLPKGSNSGIYLQGRYEVQLFDSWGVKHPKFSDIGGIYRNWESEPGKIYMGKAPLSNPSKAPGLWQTLSISFRAPRFDGSGVKTTNAHLNYVDLNGVRIHENLDIPLPTGGPIENNEKPEGPLMIQGDHGPVAFRNIRYKMLQESRVELTDVVYSLHYGEFLNRQQIAASSSVKTDSLSSLTAEVTEEPDQFAIVYQGNLEIPQKETYIFNLAYTGGAFLTIDSAVVVDSQTPDGWWPRTSGRISLDPGSHKLKLIYFKNAAWMPPRLSLTVQASNTYPKPLHAASSYPPADDPVADIVIDPQGEVRLLRAFLDYKGDSRQRLTHTIGVGDPTGVHYAYDIASGNLVCVWRGEFADATPMWHDRGNGSFKPRGAAMYLPMGSPLRSASGQPLVEITPIGYTLDPHTGRPVFQYQSGKVAVTNKIYPQKDGKGVVHEVSVDSAAGDVKYCIASGSDIRAMPDGSFAVDDFSYYLRVSQGTVNIVEGAGEQELVAEINDAPIKYSLIW